MALIGTIRKNGWMLIVLMALALGGFILMDIVSNSSRYSMADLNTMGTVNGKTISRDDFDRYEKVVFGNSADFQRRSSAWNYFVDKAIITQEAEPLGLGVGKEELLDLEFGVNPSPMLQQRQITPDVAQQVKGMIEGGTFTDPNARGFWAELEKEIIHERLQSKLLGMISKGVYAPQWQAEMAFREINDRIDMAYVRVPFEKVPDADIKVTDSDLAAYLKAHSKQFYQYDEVRTAVFVAVDVVPTAQDSAESRAAVAKLVGDFRAATNDSTFVQQNQGMIDGAYKRKDALPPAAADSLTSKPVGTVIGPYLDNGSWTIAKILDRKSVPDSVRARHILIKTGNASATVDSLKNLVEKGQARFDSLAAKFGTDGTATKGGDLGWFAQGAMVPEFNDLCFNKAEQGKLYKVQTQFGFHLVEVTGKKFLTNESGVRFASISQRVVPSAATQQTAKDKAISLSTNAKTIADLEKMAGEMGLSVQNSMAIRANDFYFSSAIQGNVARELVRWTFDEKTQKGQVSKEYFTMSDQAGGYFDSKYIVVALKTVSPKGEGTVEGLRPQLEGLTKNRKKAEALIAKLQGASDLQSVAGQYAVTVDTARLVSFGTTSLAAGNEPRVIGTAFAIQKGAVSKPLEGTGGVYLVQPISDKPQSQLPPDMAAFRRQAVSTTANNVKTRLMSYLRREADVEDNRSRFF